MESPTRQSAKIYQFPERRSVRSAVSAERKIVDAPATPALNVAAASSWYHDAAIEEAKPEYHLNAPFPQCP